MDYLLFHLVRLIPGSQSEEQLNWEVAALEQQVMDRLHDINERFLGLLQKVASRLQLESWVQQGREFASEHPVLMLGLAAVAVVCSVPVLAFICFALSTLALTFLGFVFVEGTLLTIGTVVLGGILLIGGFCALSVFACLAIAYLGATQACNLLSGASRAFYKLTSPSPPASPHPSPLHPNKVQSNGLSNQQNGVVQEEKEHKGVEELEQTD